MSPASSFRRRMAQRTAERLAGLAAHGIAFTAALVVIHIAGEAPEFAAMVIAGGLVTLAIYKRPATTIHQHFDASDLTLNATGRIDLSTAMAVKAMQEIVDAAKNHPQTQENNR